MGQYQICHLNQGQGVGGLGFEISLWVEFKAKEKSTHSITYVNPINPEEEFETVDQEVVEKPLFDNIQ